MNAFVFPDFNPVALQLGPLVIRWYALAYITGIVLAWRYVLWLTEKPPRLLSRDNCDDLVTWCTVGIIVGGRLGQVLLWEPSYYFAHPAEIVMIWKGGMAFHGGLLGVILAMLLYGRAKKIPFFAIADPIAAATPLGLLLGRIANFINGELWGRPTDVPWAVIFPKVDQLPRHPSQLYEAGLEGVALFLVLYLFARREKVRTKLGMLSGVFLMGYAVARMIGEQFREPEVTLPNDITTWGQWLSVPMLLYGLYLVWRAKPLALPPAAKPSKP
ncbi:MAG TPA: prolipoprotein diacylglyceryl transferase [Candidatus Binatia bacterium]|nr:prolipoprotein diacylglyceryl transferase [Candidatus Binatia bacterium]